MAKKEITIEQQAAKITDNQLPKFAREMVISDTRKIGLAKAYAQGQANKAAAQSERDTALAEISDKHGELPKWLINKIMIEGEDKCTKLIEAAKLARV